MYKLNFKKYIYKPRATSSLRKSLRFPLQWTTIGNIVTRGKSLEKPKFHWGKKENLGLIPLEGLNILNVNCNIWYVFWTTHAFYSVIKKYLPAFLFERALLGINYLTFPLLISCNGCTFPFAYECNETHRNNFFFAIKLDFLFVGDS